MTVGTLDSAGLCGMGTGAWFTWSYRGGLRPVVSLASGIEFSGAGTEENPYVF